MSVRDNRKQSKRLLRKSRHETKRAKQAMRSLNSAKKLIAAMSTMECLTYLDALVDWCAAVDEYEAQLREQNFGTAAMGVPGFSEAVHG